MFLIKYECFDYNYVLILFAVILTRQEQNLHREYFRDIINASFKIYLDGMSGLLK